MKREIPEPWASAMVEAGVTDPRNAARPSWSELGRRIDVHASTLIGMADGSRKTDQETITKVADALRTDRNTVASWVGRARTEVTAYKPPAEADLLDKDERKAVNQLITLLARSKRENGGNRMATDPRRGAVGGKPTNLSDGGDRFDGSQGDPIVGRSRQDQGGSDDTGDEQSAEH